MPLPKAVEEQSRKAEEAQNKLAGPITHNPDVRTPLVETQPKAQPADQEDQGVWEHRYNSLKGMFEKQQGESKAEIERLQFTINNQNNLIALMQSKLPQDGGNGSVSRETMPNTPKPEAKTPANLNLEDFEGYGDEMVDLVKLVQDQATTIANLKDQGQKMTQITKRTQDEAFFDEMDRGLSNWEQINDDPLWGAYLMEVDPKAGGTNGELLNRAWESRNHVAALAIFNDFLARNPGLKPSPQPTEFTPTGVEGQITPGSGAGFDTHPDIDNRPTVTSKQFTEACRLMALGKMDPKEFEAITANYQRAIQGGLIEGQRV